MRSPIRLLACALVLGFGCGDTEPGVRVADQAELEAEFGRRTDDPETVADADGAPAERPPAAVDPSSGPVQSTQPPREGGSSQADAEARLTSGSDVRPAGRDPVPAPPESPPAAEPGLLPSGAERGPPPSGVERGLPSSGVDVDSLLAAAEAAYGRITSLRASFVQRMEIPLLDRVSEGRGTWYQRGRGYFRMDFEDPAGDVLVADGTHFWAFQPSQQPDQVIKSRLGSGAEAGTVDVLGQILSEARTRYTSVDEGVESVAGISTHVVMLTPLGASRYRRVRVWIAPIDGLVRRFQIEEENESIRTVTLSALEPQVPLADSLFRFTPPPGVQTFEG